jgi:hypothetical protein
VSEFIITRQAHWATPADITPDPGLFPQWKYDARAMPGDIIEVHEDGFWRVEAIREGLHGWDRKGRNLIRVPGLKFDQVENLGKAKYDESPTSTTAGKLIMKHIDHVEDWEKLPWIKNIVVIGKEEVEEYYLDLKDLSEIKIVEKVI